MSFLATCPSCGDLTNAEFCECGQAVTLTAQRTRHAAQMRLNMQPRNRRVKKQALWALPKEKRKLARWWVENLTAEQIAALDGALRLLEGEAA